jgi:predicted Fe-Mo cluster-binding NifX family protein
MRIVVTASAAGLDAPLSAVFGRCPIYVFVDAETMHFEAVTNPSVSAGGGAGVQAAQFIVERGAEGVVTGNIGPNAFRVLQSAGVPVYLCQDGIVRQAVEAYQAGRLPSADAATVTQHAGGGHAPREAGGSGQRIAVSALGESGLDSAVSPHFGRCPYFVLVDVEEEAVRSVQTVVNPYYGHHQPGQVPGFIHSQGANVMLTGGMGGRALSFFDQHGIQAVTGAAGTVREAVEAFLSGSLEGGGPCLESIEHGHGSPHA